ncbi:hypothetical protein IDSA_03895 [Pseudidiomarina salinarum]|uniref:DoxX protein n=1 Tax=Pseudidiomarina salinarum TaxID=435908 RepID=A0A094JH41_9GAMM|nr:hypothetical protein [Pseudidiomarina salinarum]KFZ31836.1 hypothetical protein IDSA_03895 [Pseudidiomarina salinarum]RUO70393.1 hypothetical protein CWI79_02690 [Pseudidiomarina salinarum]
MVGLQSKGTKVRLQWSLFALRLGVFIVMLVWTLDKFVNPGHSAGVFENFYFISGLGETAFFVIGIIQLAIIIGFLLGFRKRITYGLVLIMHGISTLASFPVYLSPFNNLLFFAAWPMLAACLALYLLRDEDQKLTI